MLFAVPAELRTVLAEVQEALSAGEQAPPMGLREVLIGGEVFQFPYRTYYPSSGLKPLVESFDGEARSLGLGMCSRHWDGRVREWAATELDPTNHVWASAFVIQLLGEYVVGIARVIEAKIAGTGAHPYIGFAQENSSFLATTKRRATSYWDCYYRSQYATLSQFPNYRALAALEAEARSAA